LILNRFNLADWLGKSLPAFFPSNQNMSPKTMHIISYARLVFIPLVLLCNVVFMDPSGFPKDRVLFPLVFGDIAYFMILFLFALSNGWISTVLLMTAPNLLKRDPLLSESLEAQRRVGDWMVLGLSLGLASGSLSSFGFRGVMCQCNPFITS
jgi:equilibrative nucleoside transporter 1/2/3